MHAFPFWLAVGAYATAGGLTYDGLRRDSLSRQTQGYYATVAGLAAQGYSFWAEYRHEGGLLRVDLTGSMEMVVAVLALLYVVGGRIRSREVAAAGLALLPLMAASLLISRLIPSHEPLLQDVRQPWLVAHLVTSLAAYGLFCVATILAVLDAIQERSLRTKHLSGSFAFLPSIGALERALFGMIWGGFALLTASIVSGAFYSLEKSGTLFQLSHKVLFTWATWVLFAVLVGGHHFYGWRGKRAVRLTLVGMVLLALAYFGVKFVREVLLGGG